MRVQSAAGSSTDVTDRIARLLGVTRDFHLRALLASQSFSVRATQAAVAAQFSRVQLFNPAASGKTLVVYRIVVDVATTLNVHTWERGVALTTLAASGNNELVGGAVSVAQVRTESAGATGATGEHYSHTVPALTPFSFPNDGVGLFVIPQGKDITVEGFTVNIAMTVGWSWLEVDPVTFL